MPNQIITQDVHFDSVGYAYRALSWLDVAKKSGNICALHYAAYETRQSIEHLLFEAVVLSVGTKLSRDEYQKCKGNSTKLHKIVLRLNPDYEKMVQFTRAVMSTDPKAPQILAWDHKRLLRYWGEISKYLHWAGEPKETCESPEWLKAGVAAVGNAAEYIWNNKTNGYSGIMMPDNMEADIRSLWERFKNSEIDLETVTRGASHPVTSKEKTAG
jgi:hypothetical protein